MTHPIAADEAKVVQAVEAMTAAFHDGDLKGVLASYMADAAVAFEPGRPVRGEAALSEGFLQFFSVKPKFTYGGHDVLVAGDMALHISPWSMTGTAPDGASLTQRGLSVAVLRRSVTGGWKLVLDNPFGDHLLQTAGIRA